MNVPKPQPEEIEDPALARLLSLCRTEDERQRAIRQWREMQAAHQAEREAEAKRQEAKREADLAQRRANNEEEFKQLVRTYYPFTQESFEADWPILRARLAGELISYDVIREWELDPDHPERRREGWQAKKQKPKGD